MGFGRRIAGVGDPIRRPANLDDYVGAWVAVKDDQVIAAALSSRELVGKVRELGNTGDGAVAQYVRPPDAAYVVGVG